MNDVLKVTLIRGGREIELYDGEVGKFTWTNSGTGGISISAEPPRVAGQPNPAMQGLADALKNKKAQD